MLRHLRVVRLPDHGQRSSQSQPEYRAVQLRSDRAGMPLDARSRDARPSGGSPFSVVVVVAPRLLIRVGLRARPQVLIVGADVRESHRGNEAAHPPGKEGREKACAWVDEATGTPIVYGLGMERRTPLLLLPETK